MVQHKQHTPLRVAALSVVAMAVLAGCNKQEQGAQHGAMPPVPASVVTVAPHNVPVHYEFAGQAAGSREVEVRARVGGILLKRNYTEGRPVKQGDMLFQIDPLPFQTELEQARGNAELEQARLVRAKQEYDRVLPLFAEKAVSQKDRDDAVANYESAKASLQVARARLKQAQINLGYTRVTAPISGLTSLEQRSEGSLVVAGSETSLLTKISQVDPLYVNFSVPDNELFRLRKQQSAGQLQLPSGGHFKVAVLLADGSRYPLEGKVNFTDTLVDAQTGTVRSRATLANPKGELFPGQFMRVRLEGAVRVNAMTVPQQAVVSLPQSKMVWVAAKDGSVALRPVELSDSIGSEVVVDKGLKAGEQVVVDNLMKLRPGAKVKPLPARAPAAPGAAEASAAKGA